MITSLSLMLWAGLTGGALAPQADTLALRRALEQVNAGLLAAVTRGDARGAAAFYAPEGVLLPPDGSTVRGQDAIRSFWAAGAGTEITGAETSTVASGGDGTTAFLSGRYVISSRPRDTPSAAPTTARGTFLLVFRREGAAWRIVQDMWTAGEG